jgi:transcriptional regulator with XRE-family HTH domain
MAGEWSHTSARMARLVADALVADGLSQAEFCRRVGVSAKHLNQVLQGHATANPTTLDYWAFALGRRFLVRLDALDAGRGDANDA